MAHLIAWTSWFGHGGPGFESCLPLSWFIVTLHGRVNLLYLCNLSTQGLIWESVAHETSWLYEWKSISTLLVCSTAKLGYYGLYSSCQGVICRSFALLFIAIYFAIKTINPVNPYLFFYLYIMYVFIEF